ncbi:MAG: hypothetical protein ACU837_11235 [Gammaproteobacteria bacterium]
MKYPKSVDIKHAAINRFFLYIFADFEVTYDIVVIMDDWPNDLPRSKYEPFGGYFGLDLSSGCLEICTQTSWESDSCEHRIELKPGYYVVNTLMENAEYENYRNNIVAITGESDTRYHELVDKLGAYAWIPNLLFVISLLFSFGREVWGYSLLVVIISWIPYYALRRTKRYSSTEQAMEEYRSKYPDYVVQIKKHPKEARIPGGYVFL